MKNAANWQPSKYQRRGDRWRASRDVRELKVGSRLMANLVVAAYETHLPQHARGRLLDLGCGKAPLYGIYAPLATTVTCIDRAVGNGQTSPYVDQACDLTQPLPFAAGSFDTLILSDVLEHIPTPQALWDEMARVLAADGHLLLNVPFFYWLHERPHDYFRYSEFALRMFSRNSGLEVIALEALGGSPEILADFLAKHLQLLPVVGKPMAAVIQWLAWLVHRSRAGKRLVRASAPVFPLGYFMVVRKRAAGA